MSKDQLLYLAIAILVVAVVVLLIISAVRKRRSGQLREQFGPEYDRTLQTTGDRRSAEAELAGRAERRKSFEVRPVDPAARDRYQQQWQRVQAGFVDARRELGLQGERVDEWRRGEIFFPSVRIDETTIIELRSSRDENRELHRRIELAVRAALSRPAPAAAPRA